MRLPDYIDRRDREPLMLPGHVVLPSGRSIPVTLVDKSPEGWRVQCEETLPIAAVVRLELGDAIADAHVRWALPGMAGLQILC